MLVYTLKRAAGVVCFKPEQTIDLPDEVVAELVKDGAVRIVEVSKAEAEPEQEAQKQSDQQNRKRK